MRPLALLTTAGLLLTLQQLFSLWFIADFFLARDSSTVNELWKREPSEYHKDIFPKINRTINHILDTQCSRYNARKPDFEKLIFVVIDALGAEFLPIIKDGHPRPQADRKMPFIETALQDNRALGFIAKAATPTVTMPRIKALLSGTIPSFVDILYNLASDVSKFEDENLIGLARASNKSIVFYGDDTWLSLFNRSMFKRSKETLSLFASDYTTVDTNVTELALPETTRSPIDWDLLIMHYLGLDHIGHVFGSNEAPLINKKLLEMDDILKTMSENMARKDVKTLMVICGDHGMSTEGNHGGDSELESNTALVFLPINTRYSFSDINELKNIDQIDLAITLSFLLGYPLPSTSKGVVIEGLLRKLWNDDEIRLSCVTLENILELLRLSDLNQLEFSSSIVNRLIKLLQVEPNIGSRAQTASYRIIANDIKADLTRTVASQSNHILLILILAILMFLSILSFRRACIRLLFPLSSTRLQCIIILLFLPPILFLGSTDYIEMENKLWPFMAPVSFFVLAFASYIENVKFKKLDIEPIRIGLFMLCLIITTLKPLRTYLASHATILPYLAMIIVCNYLRQNMNINQSFKVVRYILIIAFGLCLVSIKYYEEALDMDETKVISVRATIQQLSLATLLVFTVIDILAPKDLKNRSKIHTENRPSSTLVTQKCATFWMALSFMLMRSNQYTFLIANVVLEANTNRIANSVKMYPLSRAIIYSYFAISAFYAQGNTNLFSSIDVKPAFFGQTQYNIFLAVPLVTMATYSMQVYWHMKLLHRIQEQEREKYIGESGKSLADGTYQSVCDFVNLRNFLSLGYYMFVCVYLRNHLFIWSVISPKLVYHYVTSLVLLSSTLCITLCRFLCHKSSNSG